MFKWVLKSIDRLVWQQVVPIGVASAVGIGGTVAVVNMNNEVRHLQATQKIELEAIRIETDSTVLRLQAEITAMKLQAELDALQRQLAEQQAAEERRQAEDERKRQAPAQPARNSSIVGRWRNDQWGVFTFNSNNRGDLTGRGGRCNFDWTHRNGMVDVYYSCGGWQSDVFTFRGGNTFTLNDIVYTRD
ncbi:MAG: cell envelope integrity protein TolA [Chitinivibrionia bacterium]|nr:cell envelope integrity protein TolA [Chitinivibrionia bacterium]